MTVQYLTDLFQIPIVEQNAVETIQTATDHEKAVNAAHRCYAYRARDIDAFARIPAHIYNPDEPTTEQLISDLHTYRARQLLFKDIRDVERGLHDDPTPVIAFMEQAPDAPTVRDTVEDLYRSFNYSDASAGVYQQQLAGQEHRPTDLLTAIEDTMAHIQ